MLINIFGMLLVSFCIAIVSLVYTVVLPFEPIGNKWYNFLKWLTRGNKYFFKPLIDCSKCFAGQVAIWGYFFAFHTLFHVEHFPFFKLFHVEHWGQSYSIPGHIFTVCCSILFAELLNKYYDKL